TAATPRARHLPREAHRPKGTRRRRTRQAHWRTPVARHGQTQSSPRRERRVRSTWECRERGGRARSRRGALQREERRQRARPPRRAKFTTGSATKTRKREIYIDLYVSCFRAFVAIRSAEGIAARSDLLG